MVNENLQQVFPSPRELREISSAFAQLADALDDLDVSETDPSGTFSTEFVRRNLSLFSTLAQAVYTGRISRSRHLNARLFGEPAWDMLLDLLIQGANGKSVRTSSAIIGAHATMATGLRLISTLENAGLVWRAKSNKDSRVTYISLTPEGYIRVSACLWAQIISLNRVL